MLLMSKAKPNNSQTEVQTTEEEVVEKIENILSYNSSFDSVDVRHNEENQWNVYFGSNHVTTTALNTLRNNGFSIKGVSTDGRRMKVYVSR